MDAAPNIPQEVFATDAPPNTDAPGSTDTNNVAEDSTGNDEEPRSDDGEDQFDDERGQPNEDDGSTESGSADDTAPLRERRSKTIAERRAAKGRKAGNQGNFKGEAYKFLAALLPQFVATRAAAGAGKNSRLAAFRTTVVQQFWARFKWTDVAFPMEDEEATTVRVNSVSSYIAPHSK